MENNEKENEAKVSKKVESDGKTPEEKHQVPQTVQGE